MVGTDPDLARRLKEVLLGHLQAASYPAWPGADGLTVDDALSVYLRASTEGLTPGPAELRVRHPDLAEVIERLFPSAPEKDNSEK